MTEVETTELVPGYRMSRLIKGGWHLAGGHGSVDRRQAKADMVDYVRAGITTFDCADHYIGVEQLIGDFRREALAAGDTALVAPLKIHTKYVPDLDTIATTSAADARAIIDRSLARLGQERLDLVQFHWWDYAVPRYVEVAGFLRDLQREGKIDLIGITNFSTARTREMLAAGIPIAAAQIQYSLLDHRPEQSFESLCREHGIALLCYGTLAGGFLSDRWLGAAEPAEPHENRSLTKYKLIIDDFGGWDLFQALLAALRRVADRHGADIAQVAMRYSLDLPSVKGIIVGVRRGAHLASHRDVFRLRLTATDRAEIDAVLAERTGPEGDVYELERDRNGRHGRIMRYNQNRVETAPAR